MDEMRETLNEMKNGKVSGPGDFPINLINNGSKVLSQLQSENFNKCMIEQKGFSENWSLVSISPIHKKDRKNCVRMTGI